MSKYELLMALFGPKGTPLTIGSHTLVNVCSIEREDGSGRNYNITGYTATGEKVTLYTRTVD